MKRTDGLDKFVRPLEVQGAETSYFSTPSEELDPQLFTGTTIKGAIRNGLLQLLHGFLNETYRHPDLWTRVWIAGSAVSYQWEAHREPGDLDILIGVDYVQFIKVNFAKHHDWGALALEAVDGFYFEFAFGPSRIAICVSHRAADSLATCMT